MITKQVLFLFVQLAFGSYVFANEAVFKEITEVASIANGSADVTTFDTTLSKKELQAQGKAELEKEYWEGCGPWRTLTSRRDSLREIERIESFGDPTDVAQKLNALYKNDEILVIVGAISSPRVECSLYWFNIYGKDGSKLELRYNIGD